MKNCFLALISYQNALLYRGEFVWFGNLWMEQWPVECDLYFRLGTSLPKKLTLPATTGCMPGDINFVHLHTLPYFKKIKSVFALISTRDQTKIMYCVIDRFLCLQLWVIVIKLNIHYFWQHLIVHVTFRLNTLKQISLKMTYQSSDKWILHLWNPHVMRLAWIDQIACNL